MEHGKNGLCFRGATAAMRAEQLAAQLQRLLAGFPGHTDELGAMRARLRSRRQRDSWESEWRRAVAPVFA